MAIRFRLFVLVTLIAAVSLTASAPAAFGGDEVLSTSLTDGLQASA
jgi:hypothetical protein